MVMGGALWSTRFRNHWSGVPNSATAATCEATDAGIGPVMSAGKVNPAGTALAVV